MSRIVERLIDFAATLALLVFAYLFRTDQPTLAGVVTYAAVQFWLRKNAQSPDVGEAAHSKSHAGDEREVA